MFSEEKERRVSDAKEASVDAAVVALLSGLEGIVALKEEQMTALKAFLIEKDVLATLLTDFGKNYVKHGSLSQLATGRGIKFHPSHQFGSLKL